MAKFDESKVINVLHKDKAEVGKKYYYSDGILSIRKYVEIDDTDKISTLEKVQTYNTENAFIINRCCWRYIYPYEELPKKLMTNRQLAEWLAKGNGQLSNIDWEYVCAYHDYDKMFDEDEVSDSFRIHPWNSDKWIEPTLDIYERDCKNTSNLIRQY